MSMVVSLSVSTEDSNYSFILIGIHSSSNTVHDSGSAVWTWDFPFSNSLFQPFSNLSRCVHLPLDPVSYLLSLVWCVWGMVHFSLWINIEMVCSAKAVSISQSIWSRSHWRSQWPSRLETSAVRCGWSNGYRSLCNRDQNGPWSCCFVRTTITLCLTRAK